MSTLLDLIAQGENLQQDFKQQIDDKRKIARTLCAFANCVGGRLLIGIKDNRKISGCNPEEEIFIISEAAKSFCKPEVKFTSKIWKEDMRLVVEVNIDASDQRPHKAMDDQGRWKPYIRVEDHTIAANKILMSVWSEKFKSVSKPENYNPEQKEFLSLIKENQPVTLSQLYKLSKLTMSEVDNLLVMLVIWGAVDMEINKEGFFYSIKEEPMI